MYPSDQSPKTPRVDLTGSWVGVFSSADEDTDADWAEMPFRLSFTQRGEQLFGYARQGDESIGIPDRGRLRGRVRRRRVAFVVAVPMRYVVDSSGTPRPITEVLESAGQSPLVPRGPQQLFFAGSIAPGRDDLVRGVFHVPPIRCLIDGEPVDDGFGQVSGRFTVERESTKASKV